jgi:hypothetical protein
LTNVSKVELSTVVAVYAIFFIVGLYAQTACIERVRIDILGPPDGMQFQSSPVELTAILANQKGPLSNRSVTITVLSLVTGDAKELTGATGEDGVVRVLFPTQSANYSWYVATNIEGYPTIVSRPRSFSARVALNVLCLQLCSSKYPLLLHGRYSNLQVMVTDQKGDPVESANVTFYVNSMAVHSDLTDPRGMATAFWSTTLPGDYSWFATASKDSEVGASSLSSFVVE